VDSVSGIAPSVQPAAFSPGLNGFGQSAGFVRRAAGGSQALTYNLARLHLTSLAFTVSFWMYANSLSVSQDALALTSTDGRTISLGVGVHASFLLDYQAGSDHSYREVPMAPSSWSMFTVRVQELAFKTVPSLNYVIYKNGVLQTSQTFNQGNTRTFSSLVIGGSGSGTFGGRVDDVRLYASLLSAAQIASLYNTTKFG